jgi:hypothetical protein
MTSRWSPSFDVYESRIEDRRIIFVLDMAAAEYAPLESHPVRLQVRVAMRSPREDGLRSPDESDDLHALEDTIVSRLESGTDAVYVGRFVTGGYTTFVFYAPTPFDEREDKPLAIIGDLSPYRAHWASREDPDWEFYAEFLYPDAYACQTMMNRRLLEVFVEKSDRLEAVREIDHFAFFPSELQARTAATGLRALGFRTDTPERATEEGGDGSYQSEDEERWSLQFHRNDHLADGRPNEFCHEILEVILPQEGEYDGWGAPHVSADS